MRAPALLLLLAGMAGLASAANYGARGLVPGTTITTAAA